MSHRIIGSVLSQGHSMKEYPIKNSRVLKGCSKRRILHIDLYLDNLRDLKNDIIRYEKEKRPIILLRKKIEKLSIK